MRPANSIVAVIGALVAICERSLFAIAIALPVSIVVAHADLWRDCSTLAQLGHNEQAIAACSNAIASGRYSGKLLAGIFYNRGVLWGLSGDTDRALADFNHALRLFPRYAKPYIEIGNIFYNQKRYEEAITEYTKAIIIEPIDPIAYVNRGLAYQNLNKKENAIQDYYAALALPARTPAAQESLRDARNRLAELRNGK